MTDTGSWLTRPRPVASWIARVFLILVVAFWTWFSIASGVGETAELGIMALVMHLVLPMVLIGLLVVCWRWERIGGVLLIAAAIAMTIFFGHWYRFQETLLMLEIPVALMGILLIVSSFSGRGTARAAEMSNGNI